VSILHDIQAAILQENPDLSTILLKLRLLASRLGSEPLEDWVAYETEGYPKDVEIPEYRIIGVTYKGTWSGSFGGGIQNAPIPGYLIEQHAGHDWTRYKVRESIAGVQDLAKRDELAIDASNLILLLQDHVYEGWACNSVTGKISPVAIREIKQAVRARVLKLTLELEKRVPQAVEVTLQNVIEKTAESAAKVTQIFNQTIYGNVTHVTATDNAQISLAITMGDKASMTRELVKAGLPEPAAKEITEIVAAEKPKNANQPLGRKALDWIKTKTPKAAGGAWKIGSAVATDLLKEAALRYYGLK
jgi:hypothetical protein